MVLFKTTRFQNHSFSDNSNFINEDSLVKDISKKDKMNIDIKLLNTLVFFILFFSYVF